MKKKGELFASRNQLRILTPATGAQHGKPWTHNALANLKQWFLEGNTIAELIDKSEPETIMAEANIKTLILIQGVDAAHKTDDDIFKLIAKLEQEAASLSNITNKPKKLIAKIEEIKSDINKLVEFVDSRE